jgi:hypothetical protein
MLNWIYVFVRTEDEQLVAPGHISSYYFNRADLKNIGFSPPMKLKIVLCRSFVYEMPGSYRKTEWASNSQ